MRFSRIVAAFAIAASLSFTSSAFAFLVITEVMYVSSHPPTGDSHNYWWELTNTGTTAVDLTGYSWDDNSATPGSFVFPAVTIEPGESIIILERPNPGTAVSDFKAAWGFKVDDVTVLSAVEFGIGAFPGFGPGSLLHLFDPSDAPVDFLNAAQVPAAGISLECLPLDSCRPSVLSENGAYQAPGVDPGDIGSPGRIREHSDPVPAVSAWGITSLGLLLLTVATIKFRGALPKRA